MVDGDFRRTQRGSIFSREPRVNLDFFNRKAFARGSRSRTLSERLDQLPSSDMSLVMYTWTGLLAEVSRITEDIERRIVVPMHILKRGGLSNREEFDELQLLAITALEELHAYSKVSSCPLYTLCLNWATSSFRWLVSLDPSPYVIRILEIEQEISRERYGRFKSYRAETLPIQLYDVSVYFCFRSVSPSHLVSCFCSC